LDNEIKNEENNKKNAKKMFKHEIVSPFPGIREILLGVKIIFVSEFLIFYIAYEKYIRKFELRLKKRQNETKSKIE
jgi:hypothetical protein